MVEIEMFVEIVSIGNDKTIIEVIMIQKFMTREAILNMKEILMLDKEGLMVIDRIDTIKKEITARMLNMSKWVKSILMFIGKILISKMKGF